MSQKSRQHLKEWIATYGDPRNANADVLDWIERIPFSETRNYVQRVLENTQVYRAILAGRDVPAGILNDLKRGAHTEIAANDAQFSSSATSGSPAVAAAAPVAGAAVASQFSSNVVASTPVYDDDEPAASPAKKKVTKKTTKKKKKKKRKSSN